MQFQMSLHYKGALRQRAVAAVAAILFPPLV